MKTKKRKRTSSRAARRLKQILPIVLIVLMSVLLVTGLYMEHANNKRLAARAKVAGSLQQESTVSWEGKLYSLRRDLLVATIIGIDTADDAPAPGQSDFVTLVVVDPKAEQWSLLQLNRDTMCQVPRLSDEGRYLGTSHEQLALAHSYGSGQADSCRNTLHAVENLLYGVSLQKFIRIPLNSIPTLNDAVGGVKVKLEEDLSSFDPAMNEGASLKLTGEQAEIFVRARKGTDNPTNLARMERQRRYLEAWMNAAKQYTARESAATVANTISVITDELYSNMTTAQIADLTQAVSDYPAPQIVTVEGEAVLNGELMEFHPDEHALQQQVLDLFYERVKE